MAPTRPFDDFCKMYKLLFKAYSVLPNCAARIGIPPTTMYEDDQKHEMFECLKCGTRRCMDGEFVVGFLFAFGIDTTNNRQKFMASARLLCPACHNLPENKLPVCINRVLTLLGFHINMCGVKGFLYGDRFVMEQNKACKMCTRTKMQTEIREDLSIRSEKLGLSIRTNARFCSRTCQASYKWLVENSLFTDAAILEDYCKQEITRWYNATMKGVNWKKVMFLSSIRYCAKCGKETKRHCTKCSIVPYCSDSCAILHLKHHKNVCSHNAKDDGISALNLYITTNEKS